MRLKVLPRWLLSHDLFNLHFVNSLHTCVSEGLVHGGIQVVVILRIIRVSRRQIADVPPLRATDMSPVSGRLGGFELVLHAVDSLHRFYGLSTFNLCSRAEIEVLIRCKLNLSRAYELLLYDDAVFLVLGLYAS